MAKSQQEEERLRNERLELLKMKQGIIEESEIIPESTGESARQYEKPRGWKKVTNFFYLNKWIIIPALIAAALLSYLTVQFFTREKADISIIVAVSEKENSSLLLKTQLIEETIEMYCPDFDGNGKVHASIITINMALGTDYAQYSDVENQKLTQELVRFDNPIAICDTGFITNDIPNFGHLDVLYTDLSDSYPEDLLYRNKGVLCSKLDAGLPQDALICVRAVPAGEKGQKKEVAELRERALIVLKNIVEGNVINPK